MSDPRETLTALAADIDARLQRLDADEQSLRLDRADGTADDEHDPEGSTLSGEWQRVEALRRAALTERDEVSAALARLAAGEYGRCANCGRPIGEARLEARPMATLCIACAERAAAGS